MNKVSLLAMSVAVALTGCGGSNNTTTAQSGTKMTAIDGYLKDAAVWVDSNENLTLDIDEDTKLDVVTDEYGKFTLPEEHKGHTVFIQAIANQTVDMTRGIVTETFSLASTSGSNVVNPMTNMVVKKVVKQLEADPSLDVTETIKAAKEAVVAAVTKSGLAVDAEMIFGDYIAKAAEESKEAQALNAIGEALVDNADIDVEKQLEVADLVAKEANDIIKNSGDMSDFAPVITVPTDDSPIVVEQNHRPTSSQPIEPITIVLGDAITSFTALFTDIDDDTLTFELKELSGELNGLTIDSSTGFISGTPTKAGDFEFQVFATDEHGARSYPLSFTLTVESPNTAPVINEVVKGDLQAEIDAWAWVEGEEPSNTSLNISTLFDDADSDLLTYRVETSLSTDGGTDTGFEAEVDSNGTVTFSGLVPRSAAAGVEHITVYAKDSINTDEPEVQFTLPQIIEGTTVEPAPTGFTLDHFNGRIWKMGSFAREDGEIGYAMLTQDAQGLKFCWGAGNEMNQEYKANISDWNSDAYSILETLDTATGYASAENKDCWGVTLEQDGTLLSVEDSVYQVRYQHVTDNDQYQMLVQIGSQELFWMDSTNTPFAQHLPVTEKVAADVVEYDMTVESSDQFNPDLDGPELSYAAGKLTYAADTYVFDSILPTGFTTPGNYQFTQDNTGMEQLILEETGEDQKTRYRYVNRNFGEFYIGIKWNEDQGFESQEEYGLYTQNEQLMRNLVENLPTVQD